MSTSSSQALTLWTSPPWVCDQRPSHRLFPSLPVESNFSENSFPSFRLKKALEYAKGVELGEDAKDVWVFDIDETLLSNLPYYADHGFGLEVFDGVEFDKWVDKAMAPPIESSLKFYEEVLKLGFKVFLLTGRSEQQRGVTVANSINSGFQDWDKLILRATEDHGKLATIYKSEKRNEMVEEGYRILGNSGDQWSDLFGFISFHPLVQAPKSHVLYSLNGKMLLENQPLHLPKISDAKYTLSVNKLNTDGACQGNPGRASIGGIFRDNTGHCI